MPVQAQRLTPRQLIDRINRAELSTELHLARQQLMLSDQRAAPSEGWRTAQRINDSWNRNPANAPSMTADPYLLDDGGIPVLNTKVRALPNCAFGDCQRDPDCQEHCPDKPKATKPNTPNCAPGQCEGKATCGDHHCHGHPLHESHVDPALRATVWRLFLAALLAFWGFVIYQAI